MKTARVLSRLAIVRADLRDPDLHPLDRKAMQGEIRGLARTAALMEYRERVAEQQRDMALGYR